MAPERQVRGSMLSGMTTKQKVMAGVIVIILITIIWQVIGLMGGGSSSDTITPVAQGQPDATVVNANTPKDGAPITVGQPVGQQVVANRPPQPGAVPPIKEAILPPAEGQLLELQKKTEEKFVDQLNQLQMLRVQREIAETNQAIAAARLATVTAEKNVSDLLTKPSQPVQPVLQQLPPPQIPPGTYDNSALGLATPGTPPSDNVPPPPATTLLPPPEVQYSVVSVSMQFGRWNAILSSQGKLFNVSVGDVLPLDRSVVASISKSGVVLVKGKKRRKVSIVTAI